MTLAEQTSLLPGDARDVAEVMGTMETAFDAAFGEAWTRDQCASVLTVPGVWLLLARHGGQPAGFALSRIVLDEAELLLLAVRPDTRRRGVGRDLLDATMRSASTRGAKRLHLEVRASNGALSLYTASGFAAVGCRPGYYRGRDGSAFDAITLSTTLG